MEYPRTHLEEYPHGQPAVAVYLFFGRFIQISYGTGMVAVSCRPAPFAIKSLSLRTLRFVGLVPASNRPFTGQSKTALGNDLPLGRYRFFGLQMERASARFMKMMKNTEATTLTMAKYSEYFSGRQLSTLKFPNGTCISPRGGTFLSLDSFNIDLSSLFTLIVDWEVGGASVPLNDILAVIAFGSAVRQAPLMPVVKRELPMFWKKTVVMEKTHIQPNDADFLVITKTDLLRERVLLPISIDTYDCGTCIKKGGIHLVNRGLSQFLKGMNEGDTVSSSALREGVAVVIESGFMEALNENGVRADMCSRMTWELSPTGLLGGRIADALAATQEKTLQLVAA